MNNEWDALRRTPVRKRILEVRSKLLSDFLKEHGLSEPKSVEYQPLLGCIRAQCFTNVEAQIKRAGGRLEAGWAFCETIDISMATIAHAIWITPQGRRVDITPWSFPLEKRIIFLPDERVAVKRGYSAGLRTVYSADPRVRAAEMFELELDRIYDEFYPGHGGEFAIPYERFWVAANKLGLPIEIAKELVEGRRARGGHGSI